MLHSLHHFHFARRQPWGQGSRPKFGSPLVHNSFLQRSIILLCLSPNGNSITGYSYLAYLCFTCFVFWTQIASSGEGNHRSIWLSTTGHETTNLSQDVMSLWFFMSQHRRNYVRGKVMERSRFITIPCKEFTRKWGMRGWLGKFQVSEHKTLGQIEGPWLHVGKNSRLSHSEAKADTHSVDRMDLVPRRQECPEG